LSIHEPIERSNQAKRWLTQNLTACSVEKLVVINANRASWLGTSDSSYFMNALDSMIEFKQAGKPEMAAQIYGSLAKEAASSIQVLSVTQAARAQQVQPTSDNQQQQQQQQQHQADPQAQQQPANPQAAYPPANPGGR
jgi:preprotein translocase subunit SecF